MKNAGKIISVIMICFVLFTGFSVSIGAVSGPSVQTSLTDGSLQRGSKKTFDVWARSAGGKKIVSSVTLNGKTLSATWNDTDKTSYTIQFTQEGNNKVVVKASDGGKTAQKVYTITYKKAKKGDVIGQATWSVELFAIGNGYLVEPINTDIIEGENSADTLLKLLNKNGYIAYHGGNADGSFYLAYIADGDKTGMNYNGYISSVKTVGKPSNPQKLKITSNVPKVLYPYLKSMDFFDDKDYENSWKGYIGEFAYTNGSGWMYSVNNIYPNVGFSDTYLSDGDVVRVQYTLAYGADIGGTSSLGAGKDLPSSSFFAIANKDKLTSLIAKINNSGKKSNASIQKQYLIALEAVKTVDISQSKINSVYAALNNIYSVLIKSVNTAKTTKTAVRTSNGAKNSSSNNAGSTNQTEKNTINSITETKLNSIIHEESTSALSQVLSKNEIEHGGKKIVVIISVSFFSIAVLIIAAVFIYKNKKEKEI